MSVLDLVSGFKDRLIDVWYGPPLIPDATGSEEDYYARYEEIHANDGGDSSTSTGSSKRKPKILGTGAFGQVRLVRDRNNNNESNDHGGNMYAVKVLCKGYSINDDNTVFHPPKAGVLEAEVAALRRLNGEEYNMRMIGCYEGRRYLYLVTELCSGGDLMDFRKACLKDCFPKQDNYEKKGASEDAASASCTDTNTQKHVLLPPDIVRAVAVRILRALHHCQKHGVIHRDLKPQNVMMVHNCDNHEKDPLAFVDGLRLIDYGSGCLDDPPPPRDGESNDNESRRHNTMAGSAFYNSPEMFAKNYTWKTDVWSAGVTIYVFSAGFPQGDQMQMIFNTMHKPPSKGARDLKKMIPLDEQEINMLPKSFWNMLDEQLLVYRQESRPSAGEALKSCSFLKERVDSLSQRLLIKESPKLEIETSTEKQVPAH